ncbi:MAG TPA: DUF4097 family beta strand repeat-containing protein [Candidatus Limiplasma sp.]|nr:DUF4097 family beta strand repeat-containing protein [Candidatus Limiplasma sp.]
MKPYHKRLLNMAVILIIVGAAIAGVGYAMSKNKEGDTAMENQSYNVADVRAIQIQTDTPHVIITPVDGEQMNLSWQTNEYVEYQATLENGVLDITYRTSTNWLKTIFSAPFANNEYILEIELPNSFAGDLDVSAVSGKVIADTSSALDVCSLKSVSGVISAANLHALSDLTIKSTSGGISADAISAGGDIRLQSVSGSVTAKQAEATGAFTVKTTSGKVELTQVTAGGSMSLDSVSGSLSVQDASCAALTAKTVSGGIRPENLQAQDIELKSTSGSIRGSVSGAQGEYAISMSTVSGKSNLKNTAGSGGKTLKLSTVSGGIEIQFTGEN